MAIDATDTAVARAEELGVKIEEVEGTGSGGRVTAPDVEAFASAQASEEEAAPEEEAATEPTPEERVVVILNPDTGLGGYAFDETFEATPGIRYSLTKESYEHYKKERHNGLQVIVKA